MFAKKLTMAATMSVVPLFTSGAEGDCNGGFLPGNASGDVVVVSVPVQDDSGTDVVLFLDEAGTDGVPDALADRVFRLQSSGVSDLRRRLTDVRVEWDEDAVSVHSALEEALRLTTSATAGSGLPSEVVGFGLSQTVGWNVLLPVATPTAAEYASLVVSATSANARCDSGGRGSEACGNDCGDRGCWVQCAPGYYACCNCSGWGSPKCNCVRMDPGE